MTTSPSVAVGRRQLADSRSWRRFESANAMTSFTWREPAASAASFGASAPFTAAPDDENARPQAAATANATLAPKQRFDAESPELTKEIVKQLLDALQLGTFNFVLAYNTRAGIATLIRILKLVQKRNFKALLDLRELIGEKHLSFRVDAVSLGLFVGWFSGGYKCLRILVELVVRKYANQRLKAPEDAAKIATLVSGSIASASLVFLNGKRRRSIALYAFTRALECMYNSAKRRNYWHFWGSHWRHGDSLLFALASAQIMYAFVMRPNTLPPEYFRFIEKTGPVDKHVLSFYRANNRGLAIDPARIRQHLARKKAVVQFPSNDRFPKMVQCNLIHLHSTSCAVGFVQTFRKAFVRTFPLYLSLFLVPRIVLRLKAFLNRPFSTLGRAFLGACRSNSFTALFVSLYQASCCTHHRLFNKDHRFLYYVAGLVASSSIFLEEKSRRSELALYTFPRAADSLYLILRERRFLTSIRYGETLLFAFSMAAIMFCYEHEKDSLSPFIYKFLRRFLHGSSSARAAPVSPKPSSLTMSNANPTRACEATDPIQSANETTTQQPPLSPASIASSMSPISSIASMSSVDEPSEAL